MSEIKDGWYADSVKPPIGLIPEWIHEDMKNRERLFDICGAIDRYRQANMQIPGEWMLELERRLTAENRDRK